ncbi:hypothetical protein [Candidatus Nitrosarchaeum limnium]|nr:hypothetical protein [Candidatus Nitrosarchaeum limnium]
MTNINKQTENVVSESDNLSEIIRILSKEVKQEEDNLYRVLLCGLSAFTAEPLHMRIFAPTSEGKTYLLEKVSNVFPLENILKLASASPTSFKYDNGKVMIEEEKEVFVPLDSKLKLFEEKLEKELKEETEKESKEEKTENATDKQKDKDRKQKIDVERKRLEREAVNLINLKNKWLIFLDDQNTALWDFFKPILSQDTKLIRHNTTNKQSGSNRLQKTIFKGKPSISYASAKDEAKTDITNEIDSRFQTISLRSNPQKYKESNELVTYQYGLPGQLYEELVVSKEEIEYAKSLVSSVIQSLKRYRKIDGPVFNPFLDEIHKQFPNNSGYRSRQLKRLLKTSNLFTLCNAINRPKWELKGTKYVVTDLSDVQHAVRLIIENTGIPSHKIQAYNEVIKPSILKHGKEMSVEGQNLVVQTVAQILEQYQEHRERTYSRQQLLETYLIPLVENGFLERTKDPTNKTRDIFWIPERYQQVDATTESTLIDTKTLDESCVRSCLEKYIIRRYEKEEYQFYNTNDEIISVEELCKQVTRIDIALVKNSFKN